MKNYNALDMKGRLHSYALEYKETEKGTAITGDVTLEVDADGTIVTMRYFAYPTFNNGKTNKTYGILEEIMAGNVETVVDNGADAAWTALSGSIDVSYFVSKNSTDDELARSQKLRGSFINDNKEKKYNNKWKLDFLMTGIEDVEANDEKQIPRHLRVSGYLVDDYNKRVMEVQFQVRNEKAMDYIATLAPSYDQPYFVATWGQLMKISKLVVRKNAFGEDETDEYNSTQWIITGMNPESYEFGDVSAITVEDYTTFRAALNEHKDEKQSDTKSDNGSGEKPKLAF